MTSFYQTNRSKKTSSQKLTNNHNSCHHCGSLDLSTIPGSAPHSLQVVCQDCERHTRWLPSPQSQEKHFEYKLRLERLVSQPLKGWDRIFIRDLDRQWKICNRDGKTLKLSPKQIAHLERIEGGDR